MVTFLLFTILYPEKYLWLIWKVSPTTTLINTLNFVQKYIYTHWQHGLKLKVGIYSTLTFFLEWLQEESVSFLFSVIYIYISADIAVGVVKP